MTAGPDRREQGRLLSIAYSASGALTGPVLVGLLIDWLAGTMPWFMVGGVLLGMAALTVQLIRFAQPKEPPK
jgi:F0F1-type ATP synthase assembly protein I